MPDQANIKGQKRRRLDLWLAKTKCHRPPKSSPPPCREKLIADIRSQPQVLDEEPPFIPIFEFDLSPQESIVHHPEQLPSSIRVGKHLLNTLFELDALGRNSIKERSVRVT